MVCILSAVVLNLVFVDLVSDSSIFVLRKACYCVSCSDRTKKVARRATVEQIETAHSNLNTVLTEAADKQSVNTDRLTPRALRYARRSGGLVEPGNQSERKTNSSTVKSSAASYSTQTSVSASKTTDLRGQSSRKRRSTEPTEPETHSKKAKKELQNSSSSSNTSSSYKQKQTGRKKQGTRQSSKNSVIRKQTHRHTSHKTSNLERGKEKVAKGDKASAKATAGQASAGATAAAHIPTKKRLQRFSAATAAAGAETLSSTVSGETATASTSQSSRTATRRAATKRGGALLTSSGHLTDTTGSCASSK